MYDAITFSQNHYFGTARSMAMGNAVTALGGDLGSVVINPAGSVVAGYGQFVITPGFTISAVNSSWSPEGERAYGPATRLSQTRMNMPSIGLVGEFKTGKRIGVKAVSFGIVSTQTNNYNFASDGFGTNSRTSKIAEFADAAYGYPESTLANYNSFDNSGAPWDLLTAYQGGMYGPYGWDALYAGVTEAIADDGSYRHRNEQVFCIGAGAVVASSGTSVLSADKLLMRQAFQRVHAVCCDQKNRAAPSAIAAVRSAFGNEFFPQKTDAAVSSATCRYFNRNFIYKHGLITDL